MTSYGEQSSGFDGEQAHITADDVSGYLFRQFERAFVIDSMADIDDSADVNNGRFTHKIDDNESPVDGMWRICLRSPQGRSQGYRARAYVDLSTGYNPMTDDEVDVDGTLFIEERVRRRWLPFVMIDTLGATVINPDDMLHSNPDGRLKKERQELNSRRIAQLFRRLMSCNIEAADY